MDIKVKGISQKIMAQALSQAKTGRLEILDKMLAVLPEPRAELAPHAPRIYKLMINPEKIKDVIGKGGETINKIIAETGVEIDIEDSGLVMIAATSGESAEMAIDWVKKLTVEPEVGQIYTGKVVRVMDFGAFVEILPGRDGLVHISQLAPHHVAKVEDEVKLGDIIKVKLVEIDSQGRLNLSKTAIDHPELANAGRPARPEGDKPRRDQFGERGERSRPRH
jgi:polyribonucleotide nucleotidyltransferase